MNLYKEILATCLGVTFAIVTTILAVKCNENTANKTIEKVYDCVNKVANLASLSSDIIN